MPKRLFWAKIVIGTRDANWSSARRVEHSHAINVKRK
jgi:hypothetical protein